MVRGYSRGNGGRGVMGRGRGGYLQGAYDSGPTGIANQAAQTPQRPDEQKDNGYNDPSENSPSILPQKGGGEAFSVQKYSVNMRQELKLSIEMEIDNKLTLMDTTICTVHKGKN